MKKIAILLVFAALTLGRAAAEGPFTISVDAVRDAFFLRAFSYDFTEKKVEGSPYPYQGEGEIKAFQTAAFDDYLTALVKFAYTDPDGDFGGLVALKAVNASNLVFNADWQAWLRLGGLVKISTGNQAERGTIPHYQNFDDFLEFKFDNLGVVLPAWQRNPENDPGNTVDASNFIYGYGATGQDRGYADFAASDTADLYIPAGITARKAGLLAECALAPFAPVTLTAALGSLYENISWPVPTDWLAEFAGNSLLNHDAVNDPFVKTSINFGFRAESTKIADLVQAAAVYKLAGTTRTKKNATTHPQYSIDEKTLNHAFGVYANITPPLPGLGITVGYSGQVQTWENAETTDVPIRFEDTENPAEYQKALFPAYHGIDLRAQYTGIDKLTVTFNNNFSLSSIKGTGKETAKEERVYSWTYQDYMNDPDKGADRSESYFGLYNALGLKYALTPAMNAHFQICNQLGLFTMKWEHPSISAATDNLGLYLGANYQILKKAGFRAELRGGLALKIRNFSWQDPVPDDLPIYYAGYCEFAIPLGILVEY
jgi:hypothetical protein